MCCSNLGFIMTKMEKYEEALAFLDKAMTLARLIKDISRQASTLNNIANANIGSGRIEEAEKALDEAFKMIKDYELMSLVAENHRLRAEIEMARGDLDKAIFNLEESHRIAESINYKEDITLCCLVMGRIEIERKNYEHAEEVLEKCLGMAKSMKNMYIHALALYYLGVLYKCRADEIKMKELLSAAYEKFSKMEITSYIIRIQKFLPEIK